MLEIIFFICDEQKASLHDRHSYPVRREKCFMIWPSDCIVWQTAGKGCALFGEGAGVVWEKNLYGSCAQAIVSVCTVHGVKPARVRVMLTQKNYLLTFKE
jgi:hypothetical protein